MGWSTGVVESFFSHYIDFANADMNSVIEFGSQDLNDDYMTVSSMFNRFCVEYDKEKLKNGCDVVGVKSAKVMFSSLGFTKYDCVDLNGTHGAFKMNLNNDLNSVYGFVEKYDLVTNCGTSEHCFDQATVIRNMHNLCKVGGLMYFVLPCYGSDNHGFYHVNPLLFLRMAAANGYTIENVDFLAIDVDAYQYKLYNGFYALETSGDEIKLLDSNRPIYISIILRKNNSLDFVAPVDDLDDGSSKSVDSNVYKSFLGRNINKVAIFGAKKAGKIVYDLCLKANVDICCFVDDFEKGVVNNIPVLSFEDFIGIQHTVDVLLVGPRQAGAETLKFRDGLVVKIERIIV